MPLVLNNGDGIPSTTKVKRICLLMGDILVDHPGIFRSLDQFKMKKEGKTTMGDVMVKNATVVKGIIKKHIKQGIKKSRTEGGLVCVNILHNKLLSSTEVLKSAMISGNEEDKSAISVSSLEAPHVQYESNHRTFEERMTMFQYYGIIKDIYVMAVVDTMP